MNKTDKNRYKDYLRTKGKIWQDIPSTLDKRTTGSGVQFEGKYIPKAQVK